MAGWLNEVSITCGTSKEDLEGVFSACRPAVTDLSYLPFMKLLAVFIVFGFDQFQHIFLSLLVL